MNKLIITLFICLVQISLLNAKPIKTQAPIDNVTVFLDGAEISRTTPINLTSGINEVVVENLSSSIIDNSIRVQLGDELSLLSLTVQYDYLFDKTLSPELNAYKDSIEQIEDKMQRITNQLIAFDKESEMLKSNHSLVSDNTAFSVQKLNEAANFFRERYTNINNSISKLKLDYNELEA